MATPLISVDKLSLFTTEELDKLLKKTKHQVSPSDAHINSQLLRYAIYQDKSVIIKAFFKKQRLIGPIEELGRASIFHKALRHNAIKTLNFLSTQKDMLKAFERENINVLYEAIMQDHHQLVPILLKQGCSLALPGSQHCAYTLTTSFSTRVSIPLFQQFFKNNAQQHFTEAVSSVKPLTPTLLERILDNNDLLDFFIQESARLNLAQFFMDSLISRKELIISFANRPNYERAVGELKSFVAIKKEKTLFQQKVPEKNSQILSSIPFKL